MNGWYVNRDDKKYGPYSSTQLVEMAKKGQVLPLDWVARGESGQWMPASQVKGLFAAPTQETSVPPPLPVAGPPALSDDAFAFEDRPVSRDEKASNRASRRKRTTTQLNKVILSAIAVGVLLVIVAVIYFTTRDGSNNTTVAGTQAGTAGKGQPKGATKSRPANRTGKDAEVLAELIAKKGEPDESHTFPNAPYLEVHVWKAGNDKYDTAMINYAGGFTNLKTNISRRQVEFEIDFCRKVR